ncbi:putative cystathionine gamma-lyase 2 [Anneissia japonica]|uniref:putative cystathionine gamma-lyase 2 n=1 Tax=Anneissia japonica TaxID=1529436 RepID=UPI0014256AA3|nr:putative cystathionine gamma-lyase 2 [Anneissia japonica]
MFATSFLFVSNRGSISVLWRTANFNASKPKPVRFSSIRSLASSSHLKMGERSKEGSFSHFGTNAIHAGQDAERWTSKAVVPLISLSATFKQSEPAVCPGGYDYSRGGNPTRDVLQECVASLDNAKYAFAFSSGLSAMLSICHLIKAGDHVVSMNDLYGGSNRYFQKVLRNMGIEIDFVDCREVTNVEKAMKPNTRMVWLETPTNPLLRLVDIQAVCEEVHKTPGIIVCVDNTFSSSYFQRPLNLGADLVMCSATKYMNGHSDVVMGLVSTNSDELKERLNFLQLALGTIPSPFDCYLVNRGLKTLHLRMREHAKNALGVAKFLENSSRVSKVLYPGLPSHPQHELAKKQMTGFSGMVTFFIKGGIEQSKLFLQSSKLFTLAESLGGFESLCELPCVMTHASVPAAERLELGITDTLIRLSVGIEDLDDLIADLDQALKVAIPDLDALKQ